MLVDTATRPGMSGSPVFAFSPFAYKTSAGEYQAGTEGFKCLGIYCGVRMVGDAKLRDFQLGKVILLPTFWPILENQTPGFNEFPPTGIKQWKKAKPKGESEGFEKLRQSKKKTRGERK